MFTPLYDGVAMKFQRWPWVNWGLIGLNLAVFLSGLAGWLGDADRLDTALGVIPAVLLGTADLQRDLVWIPPPATLLTGMFLHGGWAHMLGNMLFLWVFGDNVEDAMGSLRYLAFYLACGLAGALFYSFMLPASEGPLIGASAAISGVVVAYVLLYPRAHIFGLLFSWLPMSIPAWACLGCWVLLQIGSALFGADPEIGWWAHVGGILAGAALLPVLKRRAVPYWGDRVG